MTEHLGAGRNTFKRAQRNIAASAWLREHADARGAATVLEGDAARLRGRR